MISKAKFAGGIGIVALGVLTVASVVGAQTAALSVSCSGSVSSSVITWNANAAGGHAPYAFLWSGNPGVAGSTSTSIVASYAANGTYIANLQATDASSTVATSTCSGTVTSIVPPPTPTSTPPTPPPPAPPAPRVKPSSLTITPSGNFLGRGMTVTSVGSSSFQAQVWGITYTVNWSGSFLSPEVEFFFRFLQSTSTPSQQVAVGDEVGVSGRVDASTPLVVTANVVRDYSIDGPRNFRREDHEDQGEEMDNGNRGNGNFGGNSVGEMQSRLKDLFDRLRGLQNLFRGRGGHGDNGNGNGNDNGND